MPGLRSGLHSCTWDKGLKPLASRAFAALALKPESLEQRVGVGQVAAGPFEHGLERELVLAVQVNRPGELVRSQLVWKRSSFSDSPPARCLMLSSSTPTTVPCWS